MPLDSVTRSASDALRHASGYVSDFFTPCLRLGVTGLSRSGKTVFITSLVRNLVVGGRLPFFAPHAEGPILRAYLEPQPDDAVPRFDYERHLAALSADPPEWPASTRRISELRVTIEFEPVGAVWRMLGPSRLHVDIVDYPGEWLTDLGMLEQSYRAWADASLEHIKAHKTYREAGALLAFLVFMLVAVSGVFVYRECLVPDFELIQRNRLVISMLQQDIRKYRMQNERLLSRIKALQLNDPAAWEDATRKYLGWVKPGEIIVETQRR